MTSSSRSSTPSSWRRRFRTRDSSGSMIRGPDPRVRRAVGGGGGGVAVSAAEDLVRGWLEHSPFAAHLGIELVSLGEGEAELRLPFRPELATMGDIVHGGAISSLVDTAAAAAAVSATDRGELTGGTTVDLSVSLVGAARGSDLIAQARAIRS